MGARPWVYERVVNRPPLVAVAIALWVLPRGFALMRKALQVLPASADAPHEHDHDGRTSPNAMCRSRGPEEFRTL